MENISISISKDEYENLLKSISFASTIYGIMSDSVDSSYKKQSREITELENKLCSYASEFGLNEVVEDWEGNKVLNMESGWYKKASEDLDQYEEYITYDNLSNKLAWRDFEKEHSEEEIRKMATKKSGYLGVELYSYEEKYWKEFNKHEYSRLEIKID